MFKLLKKLILTVKISRNNSRNILNFYIKSTLLTIMVSCYSLSAKLNISELKYIIEHSRLNI